MSSQADAQLPILSGEGERKGQAAYEKAVRQMMGGAPGSAAAAAAVHEGLFADRPAWMSDSPAGFTEDQVRQVQLPCAFLHMRCSLYAHLFQQSPCQHCSCFGVARHREASPDTASFAKEQAQQIMTMRVCLMCNVRQAAPCPAGHARDVETLH